MGLADLFKKNIENIKTPTRIGLPPVDKDQNTVNAQKKMTEKTVTDPFTKDPVNTTKPAEVKIASDAKQFVEGLVSIKDIIAPSAIEVDFNHIRIDNKYFRTCFVAGYPRFVGLNWLSTLINFDASMKVSMYIYPTDGKEILDDLRRKIAEMEAEISTDIQRGRVVNPATQAKLEDALNLQTDLVKGEERFFQYGLYMTLSAKTKEELDRSTTNLESALGALMIVSKRANLQMEEGFTSTLPLCSDRLDITRNMDTTSLASTFPFVSSDLSDDKGIMYGINEHNGSLVIFDRFSMQNYNSVVFASAGAGKSYMIKLEAMRSLMLGTDIIVIDPENEYQSLAESVGGQYIAFGYGEASKINPFDLSLVIEEGENALNDKVLTLHKMFKIMIGAMDPIEESILDKAVMEAYRAKGITPDPETQTKDAPLIEDLYKALIGMEEERARNLSARLEKYIKGSFAGIFNQKTTVNLKNSFVVFGIRNLEESLRPVAMHIILDYIWTIVKKELKKRILIVDEAWYLMQYEDSAAFLRGIVKRGRKYYLGVTTITQDVDDFLETPYGKEIVTNSAIQILMKQHSAAIDKVGETFYLSDGEKQLLLSADKGEGIFFAGQNHVAIQVIASEEEHNLITSNPEDILRKRIAEKQASLAKQVLPTTNPGEDQVIMPPKVSTNLASGKLPPLPEMSKKAQNMAEEVGLNPSVPTDVGTSPLPKEDSNTSDEVVNLDSKNGKPIGVGLNPSAAIATSPLNPPEAGRQGDLDKEAKPLAVPADELGGIQMEEVQAIKSAESDTSLVEAKQNPPSAVTDTLPEEGRLEEKKIETETFDKSAIKVEVEETPEEIMKKRIAQLEETEKRELEEHKAKTEKEAEDVKTAEGAENKFAGSMGSLPKYQELFKSPSTKLPPLPPLPKFEVPKQSDTLPKFEPNKPSFMNQSKEPIIPQPPQLTKKPKVEFVPADSSAVLAGAKTPGVEPPTQEAPAAKEEGRPEEKKTEEVVDDAKMTYEKLFGNDKT